MVESGIRTAGSELAVVIETAAQVLLSEVNWEEVSHAIARSSRVSTNDFLTAGGTLEIASPYGSATASAYYSERLDASAAKKEADEEILLGPREFRRGYAELKAISDDAKLSGPQKTWKKVEELTGDLRELAKFIGDDSAHDDLTADLALMSIWKHSTFKVKVEKSPHLQPLSAATGFDLIQDKELVFKRSPLGGVKEELRISVTTGDAVAMRENKKTGKMEEVDAAVAVNRMSQVMKATMALKELAHYGDAVGCERALRSVLDEAHKRNGQEGVRQAIHDINVEADALGLKKGLAMDSKAGEKTPTVELKSIKGIELKFKYIPDYWKK